VSVCGGHPNRLMLLPAYQAAGHRATPPMADFRRVLAL